MDKKFLEKFSNTHQWEKLKEMIEEYKARIESVNDDVIKIDGATKGEMFVGKQLAGKAFDEFILDVDKHKNKKPYIKNSQDNFN